MTSRARFAHTRRHVARGSARKAVNLKPKGRLMMLTLCPRCNGPLFVAASIPDVRSCLTCCEIWHVPELPDDGQKSGTEADYLELRCGCAIHRSDVSHDVDDCLERQTDEAAYRQELRRESGP
jgi:hypothetical protein